MSFHSGQGQAFERNNTAHGGWDGPRSNTATRLAYATHSEQDQLVERKSTEHIESDKPTSNSAARLTQPLGLDFENMEGGPEPTIEDSRHSPSSRTPLPIDGTHQHRQILHRNIPSSHRPDGEQQRREISQGQSHSHLTNSVQRHDISSTSLSVQANNLPNPKYQVTVEEEATSDDDETTSMYTAEGGEKAVVAYTAQIGKEKVSSSHMHMEVQMTAEDCEKKAALTSTAQNGKGTASSSHTHMPVRLTLKNRLLEEAIEDWKANNGIDELKELVYYDDDNDFDYIPNLNALISERKRYEHYCNDTTVRISRPFHVYGTEELHEHNRLRLWVNLGMQQNPRTLFPPGYKPITKEGDKGSVTETLYSQTKSIFRSSISGTE